MEGRKLEDSIDRPKVINYDGRGTGGGVDRLLTIQEVCELRKVKKTYVYWLTHQKKIPHIKIQGILRFRRSAIDRWLELQEVAHAS